MKKRKQLKGTSIFIVFKKIIEMELNEIEEYINEISEDLKTKQEKLERDYENANAEVAEDEESNAHYLFEDDLHKYFKVFPFFTYNPLLLTLYGQFENWLKKLCELDSRRGFTNLNVTDLAGNNYIEKSRKYLQLVAAIDLESTKMEWQKITEIQKIRNCIAHNDSNIIKNKTQPIEKQELYTTLQKDKSIELNEQKGDFYIKEKDFLIDTIQLIKKYLFNIVNQLKDRKVIAKNTTMPFNNSIWGQEKLEGLLQLVIYSLNLLDQSKIRNDEFKEADLNTNLHSYLESMTYNLTKVFAFFCDANWQPSDKKLLINEREKGLDKIKASYKNQKNTMY